MSLSSKEAARSRLRRVRAALAVDARARADAALARRVLALPELAGAHTVFTYLSVGSEVDTLGLVEHMLSRGLVVAAPCVTGPRGLVWRRVVSRDRLVPAAYGLREPDASSPVVEASAVGAADVAIVPGLAFDRLGYRLGYGGGYYDTFLQDFDGVSIGLSREAFLFESLAGQGLLEPHDVPVDIVVTERAVVRPQGREGKLHESSR